MRLEQEARVEGHRGAIGQAPREPHRPVRDDHAAGLIPPHAVATRLERALGDPDDDATLMSYRRIVELDEQESFQEEFLQRLIALRLHHHYVPRALGGQLSSYDELYAIAKVLARRDLATAVTMSTMVWSNLVWIGGDDSMKVRCAALTRSYNGAMCLAYSEEHHGADLLASEVTATATDDGYVLNGEKWPINRASRSEVVMLLARTASDRGARNLSLFMVEKSAVDCSTFGYLPKVKTHGLRGCDISGVRFEGATVARSALIGEEGHGLELAIKTFQVTRTLCAALSVGAAESNLRLATRFALDRQLYGASVLDIPSARDHLARAFAAVLLTDAVGTSLTRALHVVPRQFSVLSAVAKVFAPFKLDAVQRDLATVLGARFFMRERHAHGMFQKTLRDSQVVALFDGSSEVNLYAIAMQLTMLARRQSRGRPPGQAPDDVSLTTIFDETAELPPFDGNRLDLSSHGRDLILEHLPEICRRVRGAVDAGDAPPLLADQCTRLLELHQLDLGHALAHARARARNDHPAMFRLARRYTIVHAGTCAAAYWLANRPHADRFVAAGDWLSLALDGLLRDLCDESLRMPEQTVPAVASELRDRTLTHRSYGLVAHPLAGDRACEPFTRSGESR